MTVGQRWRFRRDLVITAAHRAGFSQRFLADVFDLPHSRVGAIVAEVEAMAAEVERKLTSDGQALTLAWLASARPSRRRKSGRPRKKG